MGVPVMSTILFADDAIKAVTQTQVGKVLIPIAEGYFAGPIGGFGAILNEKAETDKKIFHLKDLIRGFIDKNKPFIKDAESMEDNLQKNFINQDVVEGIINLGSEIKGNLSILFKDQEQKMDMMKNINWAHGQKSTDYNTSEDKQNLSKENWMKLGRVGLDILGIASGNILAFGIGVYDLGSTIYDNINGTFQNLEQIHKLQQKKQVIEEYFKPGGEFEKHMMMAVNYALDLVQNLCIIGILWNGLMNQFKAWLQMLKLVFHGAEVSMINIVSKKIDENPIDCILLNQIEDLQKDVQNITKSSESYPVKIHLLFDKLRDFQDKNHIENIWLKIREILQFLSSQSVVYMHLKRYIRGFSDITFTIKQNTHLFRNRVATSVADKILQDKKILDKISRRIRIPDQTPVDLHDQIRELKIVMIIAACTDKFYSEDQEGKKLLGYDLQPFVKNRYGIKFLDSSTSSVNSNLILIPQPNQMQDYLNYCSLKEGLYMKICLKYNIDFKNYKQLKDYSLYMSLKTQDYQIKGQNSIRLVLYVRIQRDSDEKIFFQELMNSGTYITDRKEEGQKVYQYSYIISNTRKYRLSRKPITDPKYIYLGVAFNAPNRFQNLTVPIYCLKSPILNIGEKYIYTTSNLGSNDGWSYVDIEFYAYLFPVEK